MPTLPKAGLHAPQATLDTCDSRVFTRPWLESALDTAQTQCLMAKRLMVEKCGQDLIGDTSQLSLQTMLGAFNRETCAREMVGASWKNPKEPGTTGREGCPLLVFLAMGV